MKTASERKAEERARKRAEGLKPRELWVSDKDWHAVQRYVEHRLKKRRQSAAKE